MSPHFAGRGTVWHQRHAPKAHGFKYPTAMALLDLDQLDQLGKVLKVNKRALLSFRSTRHLCDDAIPSGQVARDCASNELDHDVSGRVLLLTNPHILGVGFNPLSVYFLHTQDQQPSVCIFEVSNTPWEEIYRYVVPAESVLGTTPFEFQKTFHVSPFNPMDQVYQAKVTWPDGNQVRVYLGLRNADEQAPMFESGVTLTLTPFVDQSRRPFFIGPWPQTFVVLSGIYREAFALWRKGLKYYPHP